MKKIFKIQVKTAYYDKKADAFNSKLAFRDFNPYKKGISKTVRYKKSDVDYFIEINFFYVIPINVALDSASCYFYPHRDFNKIVFCRRFIILLDEQEITDIFSGVRIFGLSVVC